MINQPQDPDPPAIYEIRLKGHLPAAWSSWFNDMTVTHDRRGPYAADRPGR